MKRWRTTRASPGHLPPRAGCRARECLPIMRRSSPRSTRPWMATPSGSRMARYSGDGNLEIDFQGKAITVRSENGPAGCIIDCRGEGPCLLLRRRRDRRQRARRVHHHQRRLRLRRRHPLHGQQPDDSQLHLQKNAAEQYGGGLCNSNGSHPTVVDCTFRENSCSSFSLFGQGGGMANRYGSSPIVSNCTFVDNSAGYSAGAIGNFDASSPRVTRCVFRDNSTQILRRRGRQLAGLPAGVQRVHLLRQSGGIRRPGHREPGSGRRRSGGQRECRRARVRELHLQRQFSERAAAAR